MYSVRPSTALKLRRNEIRGLVQLARAINSRVFGSVVRRRDMDTSDLDTLANPLPGTTLFDLGGLQMDLEALLGEPVDLLTPRDLAQRSRKRVLNEAVPV